MRTLVIDRSSGHPSMAVFEDNVCVCEKVWDGEPSRAPAWMAELADVIAAHGWNGASFDEFVCGLGPGSFSGIRACLAALQGLALPDGRPVYGIASAAAVALGQAEGEERVTVVGDARRNRLWCVTYEVQPAAAQVRMPGGGLPTYGGRFSVGAVRSAWKRGTGCGPYRVAGLGAAGVGVACDVCGGSVSGAHGVSYCGGSGTTDAGDAGEPCARAVADLSTSGGGRRSEVMG